MTLELFLSRPFSSMDKRNPSNQMFCERCHRWVAIHTFISKVQVIVTKGSTQLVYEFNEALLGLLLKRMIIFVDRLWPFYFQVLVCLGKLDCIRLCGCLLSIWIFAPLWYLNADTWLMQEGCHYDLCFAFWTFYVRLNRTRISAEKYKPAPATIDVKIT